MSQVTGADAAPDPLACFSAAIARWEGLYSSDRNDAGNYTPAGKLVGTMRGVTVDAFAAFKGIDPESVSPAILENGVTLDVAAQIYRQDYFERPGIARLTWSPLAEITADYGWGSGPGVAIKALQGLVGAAADGDIGPETIAAVDRFIARQSVAAAVEALSGARAQFYVRISEPGSRNAEFRDGWLRRANWYLPSNLPWWQLWRTWQPPSAS